MPKNLIHIWSWDKNGQPVKNTEMTASAFEIWKQLFPKEYEVWKQEEREAYERRLAHRKRLTLPKRKGGRKSVRTLKT
jgi:hypothetical protein